MDNERNNEIILRNVKVHNLKGVNLTLPTNSLIVFCGVSGSGKSSLAFDTIYAEGQRRYVESLSHYARRQMSELTKPEIDYAEGLSPTISIEQKSAGRNPRSTVGTMTEIYDYLRVLFARVATPHCPISGEAVEPQSRERIIRKACSRPEKSKLIVLSPYARNKKGEFKEDFQELQRRGFIRVRVDDKIFNLEENVQLDGNVSHDVDIVIDRLTISQENESRIAESITSALSLANGVCILLEPDSGDEELFSMNAFSPKSGLSYSSLEPSDFSFNSPAGMCECCHGLGSVNQFVIDLVIDENKSIAEDCCSVASSYGTVRYGNIYNNLGRIYDFSVHTPWKKLSAEAKKVFLFGTENKWTKMRFVHPETGAIWLDNIHWRGVLNEALTRYNDAKSDGYRRKMDKLMAHQICPECLGSRLKAYPSAATLAGKKIAQLTSETISELLDFFQNLSLEPQEQRIAEELIKEICERLSFLVEVGLHYLTLDRTSPTLSGGESQRVRLASQIGCGLVGITYILDEPSIGLHPRDNSRLVSTLLRLRDRGNTVIVVEHDEETIFAADYVVDVGPGAGHLGGEIVYSGPLSGLLTCKQSETAAYLTGEKKIAAPKKKKPLSKEYLKIVGAAQNNLKNINLKIPLGRFVAIAGVSGSGKSSLITDILFPYLSNALQASTLPVGKVGSIEGLEYLDKVIAIDQSPIGRNPRSNPATYIKLFDDIRVLFSLLPESKAKGFDISRFSFNRKIGACPVCAGIGMVKIDMDFLEDTWEECSTCHAKRFDEETLSVTFKGYNIHDILEMEVTTALELFSAQPMIRRKLEMLKNVGLEYLKLGQPSTTLSGGEAQRVKLAKELVRPATGRTLFLLDEPTTGLHFHDIALLVKVLAALVDKGNSVLVIEHNLDIIKTADWVIELGPDGGKGGGEVVAMGPPEKIAKIDSPTGAALKKVLEGHQPYLFPQRHRHKILEEIVVEGAEQNNLKRISAAIPRNKMSVCTGPSGSGKSSFAFDTIYAEGQRRYADSLSSYARQFVKLLDKPKVQRIDGLSPAIAIEQKIHAGNPRSTVGTITEAYDYLRILYARLGVAHCPDTGEEIKTIDKQLVVERVMNLPEKTKIQILAPVTIKRGENFSFIVSKLIKQGYLRIRLNGIEYELNSDVEAIEYDPKRKNDLLLVIDRIKVQESQRQRLLEAISSAVLIADNCVVISRENEADLLFNLSFALESSGKSFPAITPHTFAFNHNDGMCLECNGLGIQYGANLTQNSFLNSLTPFTLAAWLWEDQAHNALDFFSEILLQKKIHPFSSIDSLSTEKRNFLFHGSENEWFAINLKKQINPLKLRWIGFNAALEKLGKNGLTEQREKVLTLLDEFCCPACQGTRLNPLARAVTLYGVKIGEIISMPISQASQLIKSWPIPSSNQILLDARNLLLSRLSFVNQVGVGYLSIDRRAPTLSGGEMQRLRLARQLGSGLTGVLYVLDEPTIGLHPKDIDCLKSALNQLLGLKNTLLLVEHDPLLISSADYILDFGPAAGAAGGHICARGSYSEILANPNSLTGAYLSGNKSVVLQPKKFCFPKECLKIRHADKHNLKNIGLDIPLTAFTVISGVSGSGKSTLMDDVIKNSVKLGLEKEDRVKIGPTTVSGISHLNKMIVIDQNPIGYTSRSDVGSYVELFPRMRELFCELPQAKIKGLQTRNFSANQRKGMCTACWGLGYKRVYMHFLPDVKIECNECKGLRLNSLSLSILYKDKNFGQYLKTTISEARIAFENHPRITRILDTLIAVGLGYLTIGQEMASLSGGEAQRIKLSRELAKRSTGKTLYLLDEPTTGLHSDDISKLLVVLRKLIDKGNTVIAVEHNLDVIRSADWLIELGPVGGEKGGYILAQGTLKDIKDNLQSVTAPYL